MKKYLSIIALSVVSTIVSAQILNVADVYVQPGSTASLVISLDPQGDTFTAMDFDVKFPNASFTTTGNQESLSSWDGTFTIGDVGGTGIENQAHCIALSMSDSNIPSDGIVQRLVAVEFAVNDNIALGDYIVTMTKLVLYGETEVQIPDVTFKVTVSDRLVFDENAALLPTFEDDVEADVTVIRTIKANEWSTICLPFDMTQSQVEEVFGSGAKFAAFKSYDTVKAGSDITALTINFEEDDMSLGLLNNYPYIIKTTKDISTFSLDGVAPVNDEENAYQEFKSGRKVVGKLIGTYQGGTIIPEWKLFLNNNKFIYSKGKTKIKGYRAYFDFNDVLSEAKNAEVKFNVTVDGEQTRVNGLNIDENDEAVYDLSGRRIEKPQQRGIYIVNGKKVAK